MHADRHTSRWVYTTCFGCLLMFATIDKIPEAIKAGRNLKIQKGDFSAEVSSSNQD